MKKYFFFCLLLSIALVNLVSCQNLDSIYDRLDKVETDIVDLKSAVKALQDAYSQGKIIKSVTPLTDAKAGGWLVTFSDNTTIRLENGIDGVNGADGINGTNGINGADGKDGKDGITPFLKIDQNGYWTVSYDNGQTFSRLLDEDGNPIKAVGQDGKDGKDGVNGTNGRDGADGKDGINGKDGENGKDGANGKDGKDGAEGLSIRLVINDAGYYVIQSYYQSDPTTVVNEIVTPYTADASRVITSITQDDKTHAITMTLADGSTFTFNMHYVSPTGIAILRVNPVYLSMGTQASVEFRVNPSNALFNLSGDDCQMELDKVGTVQTRSSYVTTPANYRLVRVEQVYDADTEEMKVGQYRAIIEDTKRSAEYDEMAALVLNVEDANGDKVQISSSAFEVKGLNYENLPKTDLPVLIINTPNSEPIVSKEEYIGGADITVLNADMTCHFTGITNIKGRGNATWEGYPKKPYAIKLEEKTPLFGFPQSKKWTLLADYCDKSLLRTAFMFEMSKACSLKYTPNYQHVELMLNGQYNGTYVLTEKVEKDKVRINIKSDGFIIEHDAYAESEPVWFEAPTTKFKFSFKYPDPDDSIVEGDDNFNYITGFMKDFEKTLYSSNFTDAENGYRRYIDSRSFARWYILMELLGNIDPNRYYVMAERGAKLEMYPAWDAEWSIGLGHIENGKWVANQGTPMPYDKVVHNGAYFARLLQDANFRADIKSEWNIIKTKIPQALANLQAVRESLHKAQAQNFTRWPILGTYQNVETVTFDTWDEEANFVFDYFNLRYNWFDTYVENL